MGLPPQRHEPRHDERYHDALPLHHGVRRVGKLLVYRPRRLLVVPHRPDAGSVAALSQREWILSGPTAAASGSSSQLQPHGPEQPLSRMGLQRKLPRASSHPSHTSRGT